MKAGERELTKNLTNLLFLRRQLNAKLTMLQMHVLRLRAHFIQFLKEIQKQNVFFQFQNKL